MPVPLYRDFLDQAQLDRDYDVEASVPDFSAYRRRFDAASLEALASLQPRRRIPYGPTRAEYFDLYLAKAPDAPVLVFFHGGYWRMLSSEDFAFAAAGAAANGITVANVNYALCPGVSIGEIVRQARAAVAWIHRNGATLGLDTRHLHVGGHSAGAHLAAMCLLAEWHEDYDLPADMLQGGILVGGLYDLSPLPYTFIQPQLQLDWGMVRRNSPLLLARPMPQAKLLVAYGGRETGEFQRQSRDFATAWTQAGNSPPSLLVQSEEDHFSSALALSDPASSLSNAIRALIHAAPRRDG
ncbi:alpha/beta hydrolase [Labrys sp. KB_33_2]|uniref:alpha/beta hydrolase n=1 Tax=Labrys sp. KB_33_2 TaxID=3237479 RepID=UPI003F92993D